MRDFRYPSRMWLAQNLKSKPRKKPMKITEQQESEEAFWIEKPEKGWILCQDSKWGQESVHWIWQDEPSLVVLCNGGMEATLKGVRFE